MLNRWTASWFWAAVAVGLPACGGYPDENEVDVRELVEPSASARDGMALIEAGEFQMGCNEAVDSSCDGDELPFRRVSLAAFQIDLTEVTQTAYAECVTTGQCTAPATEPADCGWDPLTRGEYPVVCVSHAQARLFCAFADKRLPSEAEWERAARGVDGRIYPWGNDLPDCERANSSECGAVLKPTGALPAGAAPTGPLDMAGNAGEWTEDWYNEGYYTLGAASDPRGPPSGSYRVIRGGTMFMAAQYTRTSNRSADEPVAQRFSVGFRCAAAAMP